MTDSWRYFDKWPNIEEETKPALPDGVTSLELGANRSEKLGGYFLSMYRLPPGCGRLTDEQLIELTRDRR